ncbi:MAG TPA: hypothetical protein VKZ44_08820 [Taishania sp.]|nr:hypothetical protein [Taishania sp.]
MLNKLLLLLLTIVSYETYAQSNFPLTRYGLGDRVNSNSPALIGLGNNFAAYTSPSVLNTSNPASYSFLRYQFPIFALGVNTRLSFNESGGVKETNSATNFSEMAFGLSFGKRFGMAFGLKPFQQKNYSIVEKQLFEGDTLKYQYEGKGGINKAFIGLSVNILNYDSLRWSVGGNVGAVFGTLTDTRKSSLLTTTTNAGGIDMVSQQLKSFQYDLGTILTYRFKKDHTLTVGATYEPMQNLNAVYNRDLALTLIDVDDPNKYSYLDRSGDLKGKIAYASTLNVGLSYAKIIETARKDGNKRNSQLYATVSYTMTDWSKYKEDYGDTVFTYSNLNNTQGFSVGLQYIPEVTTFGNIMPKLFDRMHYRIGFHSRTLPYMYSNGAQMNEIAGSFGFGIPIVVDKRLDSSIQLGFSAGKRGINDNTAFKETFVTFNVGLLIAPGVNDRWFIKRKLD